MDMSWVKGDRMNRYGDANFWELWSGSYHCKTRTALLNVEQFLSPFQSRRSLAEAQHATNVVLIDNQTLDVSLSLLATVCIQAIKRAASKEPA